MKRWHDVFESFHDEGRRSAMRSFGEDEERRQACVRILLASPQWGEQVSINEWKPSLNEAVIKVLETVEARRRKQLRLMALTERVRGLEDRIARMVTCEAFVVPITTFEPEPFELVRPIQAVVQRVEEDEYTATFYDGNVGTGGCNP